MANIKVSELPSTSSFNSEDYTMIIQNGENKKITKQDIQSGMFQIYYANGKIDDVATNTVVNLYNITLPAGLYVGYVMVRNQNGGTTPFKTLINFDDGNIDHAGMEVLSTGWTNYKCPIVMNLGASTTLYARAKHDSSETHTMDGELLVIKLR